MSPNEQRLLDGSDLAEAYGIRLTPIAETRICVILLGSDGIVYFRYRPDSQEGLEEMREYVELQHRQLGAKRAKFGTLVDLTNLASITREARAAHARPEATEFASALALVTPSRWTRVATEFFLFLDRPVVPTRPFETLTEARAWLLGIKKKSASPEHEKSPR